MYNLGKSTWYKKDNGEKLKNQLQDYCKSSELRIMTLNWEHMRNIWKEEFVWVNCWLDIWDKKEIIRLDLNNPVGISAWGLLLIFSLYLHKNPVRYVPWLLLTDEKTRLREAKRRAQIVRGGLQVHLLLIPRSDSFVQCNSRTVGAAYIRETWISLQWPW